MEEKISNKGLTNEEARIRLKKYGKNIISSTKEKNKFLIFILEFKDPMLLILIASSFISIMLKEYIDAFIILIVVILNVLISFVQEIKANKALDSLKRLSSPKCLVKRDNKVVEIVSEDVVPGDLIVLEEGIVVPCDAKLININHLLIDESSLTGESFPINKSFEVKEDDLLRLDYVYAGSEVLEGQAEAICISTGKNTEIGKIASVAAKKKEQTPLEKRLDKLGFQLGIITILICICIFIVSILKGGDILDVFITSISLGVAAIPEGLATVVTIVLSLGVQKMAKRNVIVSKLPSVETLGSISVICTDKTGTLTQNKMQVEKIYVNNKISSSFSSFKDEILYFMMCITASEEKGTPTECAIYNLGTSLSINKNDIERKYPLISQVPFSSSKKTMEMVRFFDNKKIKIIKGAPELILEMCDYNYIRSPYRISKIEKEKISKDLILLTQDALRLIACMIEIDNKKIFVGVLGLKDPLREESYESVKRMLDAKVSVKMITGDHKETAYQIAKELTIANTLSEVMEGKEIDSLNEKEFAEKIKQVNVFARVSPLHKMKIVNAYQSLNEVVAMTGDGVNDAPSLRKAHVGIAMGKKGKEVAKEAADIIIQDDNFYTIVEAMEEGRNIYANIRKAVLFLLSSNIAEVLVMVIGIFFSLPLPLLAIHILFINLISDSIPALCLGLDKKDKEIMKVPPRKEKDTLFSSGGIKILIFYSLLIFFLSMISFFLPTFSYIVNNQLTFNYTNIINVIAKEDILMKSRTIAFSTLCICELFHMLGMSSTSHSIIYILKKKNYFLLITLFIGIILQITIVQLPLMNTIFKTIPLSLNEWLTIFLISSITLIMHEVQILKK